jgi:3-oxoacyl-[acyl-carrier-protein] synthase II
MKRVVITGLGIVCSMGRGKDQVWRSVEDVRRAFSSLDLFDGAAVSRALVGEVSSEGLEECGSGGSRLDRMLSVALDEALSQAGLLGDGALSRFGVATGNCNGGMLETEAWYQRQILAGEEPLSAAPVLRLPTSVCTDRLAAVVGARGPRISVATACSSSASAIGLASERIRDGEVAGMIAGGGDPLCRLTFAGFAALRLLDPEGCRPFDGSRKGLTLGEGAALLVLEERDRALQRGARPMAEILEYGASCDAHHMTACHPEGRGMKAAMAEALRRSGLEPSQVDYINAHGTATLANDAAEGRAIADLFGEEGPAVSSTKSMHGHLLGGSGAVEAAMTLLCLARESLPPTAGTDEMDPSLNLDLVRERPRAARAVRALSNSFGFGGGNVVLVFTAPEAEPSGCSG